MFAFIVRRVTQAMIVMFVISIIGFGIKYSFGDPIREMVGINVSAAEREAYRDQLGLNDSNGSVGTVCKKSSAR